MGTYQGKMQPYNAGAHADINQGDPKAGPTTALARRWGGGEQHLEGRGHVVEDYVGEDHVGEDLVEGRDYVGEDHVEGRGHVGEDHVEGHGHVGEDHVGEDHVGEDHVQLFNQT